MPCSPTAAGDNPARLKILESGLDITVLLDTWISSSPVAGGNNGIKDFPLGPNQKFINDRREECSGTLQLGTSEEIKAPETSSYLLSSL